MHSTWRCDAHGITTAGDCPRCDDELIALADTPDVENGARCTCANDGSARRCPSHTQGDFESTRAATPCPSCDHDLSYPGAPGHECYTYAEWRENQRRNRDGGAA